MAKPGAGKQPRTQRDVLKYARSRGAEVVRGGKHNKHIRNPKTGDSRPVPGPGDIASGTLSSLMKWLSLTFACFIPICLLARLAVGLSSMY